MAQIVAYDYRSEVTRQVSVPRSMRSVHECCWERHQGEPRVGGRLGVEEVCELPDAVCETRGGPRVVAVRIDRHGGARETKLRSAVSRCFGVEAAGRDDD